MERKRIRRLWIFDFDGTLSDIVPDRNQAALNPSCIKMMKKLAAKDDFRVAVLSSRILEDLSFRVRIKGIYLGGGNGITWQFPDGERKTRGGNEEDLHISRNLLIPKIKILEKYPGIEIEDKKWSVAVHLRRARDAAKKEVTMILEEIRPFRDFRKYHGPEAIEIPLLPEIDKAFGIRNLCDLLDYEPGSGELVYAGDSGIDVSAMQWVLFLKGTVFTVGQYPLVQGSSLAASPDALAEIISGVC
ncbi:MAG TPA: trehalose-phosphatase [Syntrophales bacterium]|nr:trehalose-phosphatase [Syntrophales bacterium]HPL62637.1 trehalose-phosphatase [Syntrophales bacterium]